MSAYIVRLILVALAYAGAVALSLAVSTAHPLPGYTSKPEQSVFPEKK